MPEIACLSDPKSPWRIEYSRLAMQEIRERAIEGLMALPRIGMGVGGLLLGTREAGLIRLLNSIEIPCSHTGGPSFNLTDTEKNSVAEIIAAVGEQGVIGWYCSKTRGAPTLGNPEMALYRELCPEPEQIALVLRPSTVEPTLAVFFFRDKKGEVVKGIECEVDEWQPVQTGVTSVGEENTPLQVEKEEPLPAPLIEPLPAAAILPPRIPEEIPEPAPPRMAPPDMFAFASSPPPPKKLSGWILGAAAMMALGAAAFFTQDSWNPRPQLAITSTESHGTLVIRWNADAFRGLDHGTLAINDGGNLQSLPLDRFQLNQGVYIYNPKSQRVTAKLSAGDSGAITVWFAPPPKEPPAGSPTAVDSLPPVKTSAKPVRRPAVPDDR